MRNRKYYVLALEREVDELRAANRDLLHKNYVLNAKFDDLYEVIEDMNDLIDDLKAQLDEET